MLRHLVTEDFLFEDVKKSDAYGSVSSVVKVILNFNTPCDNAIKMYIYLCFGFTLAKMTRWRL